MCRSPRQRFGTSKVKTGCIPCKAARVKCDEARPHCRRCIRLDRKCEWLCQDRRTGPVRFVSYVPCIAINPPALPYSEPDEQQSVAFFLSRTARDFAGHFPTDLWSTTVMQVSVNEPAVKHAIIALGALHEAFKRTHNTLCTRSKFAIRHYQKAIKLVIGLDVFKSSLAADVALLACILFTAIECLQGHYKSAFTHVASGINIFAEQQALNDTVKNGYVSRDSIRTVFLRLETQALELDDTGFEFASKKFEIWRTIPLPTIFSSVEDARVSLDVFLNHLLHRFKKDTDLGVAARGAPSMEIMCALELQHAQIDWHHRELSRKLDQANFPLSQPAVLILEMSRALIRLLLQIDLSQGEMLFDRFHYDFEHIVTLGEKFLQQTALADRRSGNSYRIPKDANSNTHVLTSAFSLSNGIITSLWVTTARCRDPFTRRRALAILQTCNRKEGIWDSALTARVCARIIDIEEAGALTVPVTAAEEIPECARLTGLDVGFKSEREATLVYYKRNSKGLGIGRDEYFKEVVRW